MTITAPGIYPDIEPTAYFEGFTPEPALSNSIMQILLDGTPAEAAFAHPMLNPDPEIRKANAAMRTGDVVHQLALGKGRGYRIGDFERWDKRIPAVAAFLEACEADGVTPVKEKEFAPLQAMAKILRDRIQKTLDAIAVKRGVETPVSWDSEVVIAWQEDTPHGKIWCQGMIDVWAPSLMVALDPKITKQLRDNVLTYHVAKRGWDRQGVWYERGLSRIFPDMAGRITFADMMVHPDAPHVFRAVGCSQARRAIVEADIEKAMELFGRCLSFGTWPGYSDEILMLDPTSSQARGAMEAELDEDETD